MKESKRVEQCDVYDTCQKAKHDGIESGLSPSIVFTSREQLADCCIKETGMKLKAHISVLCVCVSVWRTQRAGKADM